MSRSRPRVLSRCSFQTDSGVGYCSSRASCGRPSARARRWPRSHCPFGRIQLDIPTRGVPGRQPSDRCLGAQRIPHLLHHPVLHDHDAVAHGHGLDLVVGDVDHGGSEALVQALDLDAHVDAQLGVEIGERLVEKQEMRPLHERPRERDALLLAARELLRVGLALFQQADLAEHALDDGVDPVLRQLAHDARRQRDVLLHRQVGEQVVALEHHADVAAQVAQLRLAGIEGMAGDPDAAGLDALQPVEAAQHGALAGTAAADDGHDLALLDRERDALEHLVVAIGLVHVACFNDGHGASFPCACWPRRAGSKSQNKSGRRPRRPGRAGTSRC